MKPVEALVTFLGLLFVLTAIAPGSSQAGTGSPTAYFSAELTGAQAGTTSTASGLALLTLNEETNLLSWTLSWSGIASDVSAIHFHGPATVGEDAFVTVELGAISGLISPSIGNATVTRQQQAALSSELWYINIHSIEFPAGELRGQVVLDAAPTPEPTPTTTPTTTPPRSFTNDTSEPAGFIHLQSFSGFFAAPLDNPPGCGTPTIASGFEYWEVTWPSACVDPGESVAFDLPSFGDVFSHYWAASVPIISAVNDTGLAADGLTIVSGGFVKGVTVVENAPGCEAPMRNFSMSGQLELLWDAACVDTGEKVSIHLGMVKPVTAAPYSWAIAPGQGDADCSGGADSIDAVLVLQFDGGLLAELPCAEQADVNLDDEISSIDAALILQFSAELLVRLPP